MTKVLVIGDPHFKTNNIRECELFIDKVVTCINKTNPDFIVVLGDLLDKHAIYQEAPFNLAIKFLIKISDLKKTFLIVGNHDYCNNQQFLTDKHPYNALKKWGDQMIIVDTTTHFTTSSGGTTSSGQQFTFVPYVPPGRFLEALNTSEIDFKKSTGIFAHQEFYGCKMRSIISENGDIWDKDYPFVISGHIHGMQYVGGNIFYPGTPMQHSFGDDDYKRVCLVTFDTRTGEIPKIPKIQKIDLKLPKKQLLYMNINEIRNFNTTGTGSSKEDKIKIILTCSYEDYKVLMSEKNKNLNLNRLKIIHSNSTSGKNKLELINKELHSLKTLKINDTLHLNTLSGKKCIYNDIFEKLVNNTDNDDAKRIFRELFY